MTQYECGCISSNIIESVFMLLGVPIAPLILSLMIRVIIIAMPSLIVSVGMGYFFHQLGPKRQNDCVSYKPSIDPPPCASYLHWGSGPLGQPFNMAA